MRDVRWLACFGILAVLVVLGPASVRAAAQEDKAIKDALDRPVTLDFPDSISLNRVLKTIKQKTVTEGMPQGVPIYVDPEGLKRAGATMESKVTFESDEVPLRESLPKLLDKLKLRYVVEDGLLQIRDKDEAKK